MDREYLKQTIQSRLGELGISAKEASLRAVGNTALIANIGRERYGLPSVEKLEALADVLDLEFYFGPRRPQIPVELLEELRGVVSITPDPTGGRGPDYVAHRKDGSTVDIDLKSWKRGGRRVPYEPPHLRATGAGSGSPASELTDFAHIPVHEATLAAGSGALNGDAPIVDHLAFKRSWLSRIGVAPANAVLARVALGETGESMMPTINPGDMVLIDTSKREIPKRPPDYKSRKSPIYAFTTDDGARVKRLAQLSDMIILVSDNPDVPPEFIKRDRWSEVNVIGKVVWWGHTADE